MKDSVQVSVGQASRTLWRQYLNATAKSGASIAIGVAATYTCQTLVPHLGSPLVSAGFAPEIFLGPYNQIFQICADPTLLSEKPLDVILILPRFDELCPVEIRDYLAGDTAALVQGRRRLTEFVQAVQMLRKNFGGTLMIGTLPYPEIPESNALDVDRGANLFVRHIRDAFEEEIGSIDGVSLVDLASLQADFGVRNSVDPRTWYLFRQPYAESFLVEIGALCARIVIASRRGSMKCVAIDADNTLWGGVIGEDGIDNIRLGDEFPGTTYRDVQRFLKHLRGQGVFLAVLSKNNPEDVLNVFRSHDAMVLREDDISVFSVSWRPKSEGIVKIAEHLNIGVDSIVFLDDSAFEIAEVRAAHPSVACVQVPPQPEKMLATLRSRRLFDKLAVTQEDRNRADSIALNNKREELRSELSEEEFIKNIELKVVSFPVDDQALVRVTQLINKTNQFNINTPRLSQENVRALSQAEHTVLRAARVSDRYGEYGLTCVGAVSRRDAVVWDLDIFLMSCRVLGRGVETSFLSDLANDVLKGGGTQISAKFIPTQKNKVSADFLQRHGFTHQGGGVWVHDAAEVAANRPALGAE